MKFTHSSDFLNALRVWDDAGSQRGVVGSVEVELIESPPLSADERILVQNLANAHRVARVDGSPLKARSHGARSAALPDVLTWIGSVDSAFPRLNRVDTVGRQGFLVREAWYRSVDLVFGLTETPKPGATPVYAIDYPSWTWGTLPGTAATKGIIARGSRTQTLYGEDGSAVRVLTDDEPKLYSFGAGLDAGARRRINVVGTSDNAAKSRVASIATAALLTTYPTEDPGPRAGALLHALDGALRAYRGAGLPVLHAALTAGPDGSDQRVAYDALLAAHPWLLALVYGIPAITLLADEVEEPVDGLIAP